ncbi:hypothetical protein BKA69DRAFT_1097910 [Paraphysoderma sedebokerense]|nr:hypothetical protein BKA69DRAFT_1097910 [Paraphysoderma sedebokerense]
MTIETTANNSTSESSPLVTESQEHIVTEHLPQSSHPRTILISVDSSAHSKYAFEWAKEHLLTREDLVVLVNVRPVVAPVGGWYEDVGLVIKEVEEETRNASHRLLQYYGTDLKSHHYNVRAISIRGDARSDIVRKASELNADLVVLGSRGLGLLQRTLLGSVSSHLAHHCECPVLIVRPPKDVDLKALEEQMFKADSMVREGKVKST